MHAELKVDGQCLEVPAREKPLPWQEEGLRETASGLGVRITTRYQVFYKGKWRRVYACQIANAGTYYIGKPGKWDAIVEHIER